jgi:hypothetical protein
VPDHQRWGRAPYCRLCISQHPFCLSWSKTSSNTKRRWLCEELGASPLWLLETFKRISLLFYLSGFSSWTTKAKEFLSWSSVHSSLRTRGAEESCPHFRLGRNFAELLQNSKDTSSS